MYTKEALFFLCLAHRLLASPIIVVSRSCFPSMVLAFKRPVVVGGGRQ